jgi:hypothetical protein
VGASTASDIGRRGDGPANQRAGDAAYDAVYRRNRAKILAGKPICVYPGCTKVADTVDHIRPVVGGVDNSLGNLRPMCRRHNEALGRDLGNQRKRRKRRA